MAFGKGKMGDNLKIETRHENVNKNEICLMKSFHRQCFSSFSFALP